MDRAAPRACINSGRAYLTISYARSPRNCGARSIARPASPSAWPPNGFAVEYRPMLADVRVMRHDGKRLARERITAASPVRGNLSVSRRRDPYRSVWVPVAILLDDRINHKLPALDQVSIAKWRGPDLVLVGVEHIGRLKSIRSHVQSWWVQLVPGALTTTPPYRG